MTANQHLLAPEVHPCPMHTACTPSMHAPSPLVSPPASPPPPLPPPPPLSSPSPCPPHPAHPPQTLPQAHHQPQPRPHPPPLLSIYLPPRPLSSSFSSVWIAPSVSSSPLLPALPPLRLSLLLSLLFSLHLSLVPPLPLAHALSGSQVQLETTAPPPLPLPPPWTSHVLPYASFPAATGENRGEGRRGRCF
ncbi:unnamed protein product [Closterium sp. NIES-54]